MKYPDIKLLSASPPDELEASPAGSRSDDYSLAFLWFSAPPPPKLRTILVCCCCSNWPGLPEPPSLRSKTKRRSQCFRALPANENSPPFTGDIKEKIQDNRNQQLYSKIRFLFQRYLESHVINHSNPGAVYKNLFLLIPPVYVAGCPVR